MRKVFESFDFSQVGRIQSLLESHGIETYVKNQYASSVMGEIPFVEVCPQLFILNSGDLSQSELLIKNDMHAPGGKDWKCPSCGIEIDGVFSQCWKCGTLVAP